MKRNRLLLLILFFCSGFGVSGQRPGPFGNIIEFNTISTNRKTLVRRPEIFATRDTNVYGVLDYLHAAPGQYNNVFDQQPRSPILLGVKLNPALTDYRSGDVLSTFKSYKCYIISDSSSAILIALGITPENIKDYRYHVVEDDKKEIVSWSPIPKLEQLYGAKRPFGFIGNYKAPGKKIMVEVINSKDYGIRDGIIFDFSADFKPSPVRLTTFIGRDYYGLSNDAINRRYATRFDSVTHLPLDLKMPADSVSSLNMEVKPHETVLYDHYLIREYSIGGRDSIFVGTLLSGTDISLSSAYYSEPGKYTWVFQRASDFRYNYWKKEQTYRFSFEVMPRPVLEKKVSLEQVLAYLFWVVLAAIILFFFFRRRYQRRLRKEKQARQVASRQLRAVRAQLNPHFIFNALSSIQNLMNKKEVDSANHYLVRFASLTRKVLDSAEQELISVEEEIKALDDYLQMEQLRFRFQYSINVDEAINQANTEIPAMLLQPFVENAVIHAVSGLHETGRIEVAIRRRGKDLTLSVKDNGPGFVGNAPKPGDGTGEPGSGKSGLGIRLSKERIMLLNELYKGKTASINIHSMDTGTQVNIQLNNWL